MKLNLYFSDEEIKEYLLKKGYKIKKVKSWNSQNSYHNKVEFSDVNVTVAYKKQPSKDLLKKNYYDIKSEIGIEMVFENEIKKSILSI